MPRHIEILQSSVIAKPGASELRRPVDWLGLPRSTVRSVLRFCFAIPNNPKQRPTLIRQKAGAALFVDVARFVSIAELVIGDVANVILSAVGYNFGTKICSFHRSQKLHPGPASLRLSPAVLLVEFSNLDRPSLLMASCLVPAARRWAGPAPAFEHLAMRWLCLLTRGSSSPLPGSHRFLLNRYQSFDRYIRASGQIRRPCHRRCTDRRARYQRSKLLRRSLT